MKNEIKKTGYVEVEDITVQEAIKKALKQLNATKEDVLIKVLKEEQKGLFGMQGAEKAKIRATLKPQSKKQE
jgi:predicted RNA-binding protein Jag